MRRFSTILSILCLMGIAPMAQAGFHMEPHIGFGVSNDWEQSESGNLSRTYGGIKLGYQADMGLQVGGELQIGSGTYEANTPTFTTDVDYADVAIGPYLGYQSMMGIRGYLGVFQTAQAFNDASDSVLTGIGYKFGVGYRFVKWFALNLEYVMESYDEVEDNNPLTGSSLDPKFQVSSVMIVASFPFNFGGK